MARKTHHVVPNSSGDGWAVKRGGASKASKLFDTKKEAEQAGREISRNHAIKRQNLSSTVKMAKSSDLIAMAMIRILQKDNAKLTRFTSFLFICIFTYLL